MLYADHIAGFSVSHFPPWFPSIPAWQTLQTALPLMFQTELLTATSLIPQKPFPPPVFSIFVNVSTHLLRADAWRTASIPSLFFNFLLPGLMISTSHIYFPSVHLLSLFSLLQFEVLLCLPGLLKEPHPPPCVFLFPLFSSLTPSQLYPIHSPCSSQRFLI